MSIEMQIFYHTINSIVSAFYYVCQIILLSNIVEHKKHITKTIFIYIGIYLSTTVMTETAVPVLVKSSVQLFAFIIMYGLLLTDKVAAVAVHMIFFDMSMSVQENAIILVCKYIHFNPWVDVGHGVQLGKASVILLSSLLQFILTLLLKKMLKSFSESMKKGHIWILFCIGYIFDCMTEMFKQTFWRFVEGNLIFAGLASLIALAIVLVILYLFFVRFSSLERREREQRIQRESLEKQFAFYQEKQKEEEKVRSIYHDMKNHLLVLEHQMHSPETAEMVEKLQRDMESYGDYVHTGNDFLDVIIKDKAGIAREKQIDFSAVIDMQGMDFIEPLDISTIFGNGLDNAIEAGEKLPSGEGVIVVKAGRVQDFLSILMENNCLKESVPDRKHTGRKEGASERKVTSKEDKHLHGFGIPNMKSVAEKYEGQLTTKCEDGKFTLKILIPVP